MAAIKNDHAETARNNFGEPSNRAGRIGQLKFGGGFSDCRYMTFVHENNHSRSRRFPGSHQRSSTRPRRRSGRLEEHRAFADDCASSTDADSERAAVLARNLDVDFARPAHLHTLLDQE